MFDSFGHGGWRFNLFGFAVRVDASFWIVAVLLGLGLQDPAAVAIWVAVVFVSILAHELGHAFMGRAFGLHGDIELYSMGGLTRWIAGPPALRPGQRIAISLAGPCTGLAIGAGLWAAVEARGWPDSFYWWLTIRELLWVNIAWGLLNLLPILPLDGGHVCQSAIHWLRGYEDDGLPLLISAIFGAAAGVAALLAGMFWPALLALWFTVGNIVALRQRGPLRLRDTPWALLAALVAGAGLLALMRFTGRM